MRLSLLPRRTPPSQASSAPSQWASSLACKGFTTITNSGSEIKEPKENVGRALIISQNIWTVVYLLVSYVVAGNLSIGEIIAARDYPLAEASRPAYGELGGRITVVLANVSIVFASVLIMLTEMKLVPHNHFGTSANIQKHTMVLAIILAAFFRPWPHRLYRSDILSPNQYCYSLGNPSPCQKRMQCECSHPRRSDMYWSNCFRCIYLGENTLRHSNYFRINFWSSTDFWW